LGAILFEKLAIPYKGRKTKTGQYSTSEEKLADLAGDYKIAEKILDYRELHKLKSTYVDALPKLINPKDNRIHTTLNQAVAATGRLSSNNPNLQNIPIRTEKGRKIRKAFIPQDEKHTLLAADYSQIELRLVAEISEDGAMLEAFRNDIDIHAATASRIYGVDFDNVDQEMRRSAKTVNFGIIYGISAYGLSQRLGVSREEASKMIDQYFEQYPGIKAYMDRSIEEARKQGYVETLLGRKRYLKDINSRNATVRGYAERNAINTPIQGTAADMIKIAMNNIYKRLKDTGVRSNMTMQVHDELVFDAQKEEVDGLKPMIIEEMKKPLSLKVPVVVEIGTGDNWLEAH
jgi:DNA polymerase-1